VASPAVSREREPLPGILAGSPAHLSTHAIRQGTEVAARI